MKDVLFSKEDSVRGPMAERSKLLYVIVHDEAGDSNVDQDWSSRKRFPSSRYTRAALQSTLQLMGCKPRHAFKISIRVFDVLRNEPPPKVFEYKYKGLPADQEATCWDEATTVKFSESARLDFNPGSRKPPKSSKKRSLVVVSRETFLDVVCDALAQYQYMGPNQRADLMLACRFRERKTSVTVLLCGTSGCGKSTLSSLLASRLGITTVVSTDSVRHMMRSFADEKSNPLLWASTYHAGDYLDPVAVKEATLRRKAMKVSTSTLPAGSEESRQVVDALSGEKPSVDLLAVDEKDGAAHFVNEQDNAVSSKTMVVQGFKAQCEMVIDSLDRLITSWEQKNESVVVEGVHLSLNFVMGLMRKHPSIVPFMIYISNEEKHLERFAVRAKYMTLDPSKNKYAKYIRNIRTIQEYLCKRADKHLVPKVNNTNVDKSVAGIHATIFSCLRRKEAGEPLYDPSTNTVKIVDQEYQNQYAASSLGSKCMFQVIQRKGSSRHLMALMNVDGSVAKAWPIDSVDANGKSCSGCNGENGPVYGPLQIGKAEPVNLHFGNLGLRAFQTETGETSSSSAGDGQSSKGDNQEINSSSRSSLSSSSPRHTEVAEKEAVDEAAVFVSEEEPEEDNLSVDSDEELAYDDNEHHQDDELEGSVSESSVRSDEDINSFEENDGYWSEEHELVQQARSMELRAGGEEKACTIVHSPRGGGVRTMGQDDYSHLPGFDDDLYKFSPHCNNNKSTTNPRVPCAKQMHSRTKSLPVLRTHRCSEDTATKV